MGGKPGSPYPDRVVIGWHDVHINRRHIRNSCHGIDIEIALFNHALFESNFRPTIEES